MSGQVFLVSSHASLLWNNMGVGWIVLGFELSRVLSLISMQGKVRKKQESVPGLMKTGPACP